MSVTQMDRLRLNSEIAAGQEGLRANEYPGRVVIMGLNTTADFAIQAYALTGRSAGSKNRIFVEDEGAVRTTAPDMTPEQMAQVENAELIYYKAMMNRSGVHVVSNGAQTEPVLNLIEAGSTLDEAVRNAGEVDGIDVSRYEPDDPNFTPRITGVIDLREEAPTQFGLTVVRKSIDSDEPVYDSYEVPGAQYSFQKGVGFGIQTYNGNSDGPLPSFDQQPFTFPIGATAQDTAENLWDILAQDKRAAVVARAIDLVTNEVVETHFVDNFVNLR